MLNVGRRRKGLQTISVKTAVSAMSVIFAASACKMRSYNNFQSQSAAPQPAPNKSTEALTESLLPYWPIPKNMTDVQILPTVNSLGIKPTTWQTILDEALSDSDPTGNAKKLTLSNPECALAADSWRVSAARLSLYEIDLPGNVTSWQTLALQRETDLAQRVQLHVAIQPWCTSERLGRPDFVHTLDHAFLLTFDLSTQHLPKELRVWLEEIHSKSIRQDSLLLRAENKILPFARALIDINDGKNGRAAVLRDWNIALRTQELIQKRVLPSAAWMGLRQSLSLQQRFAVQARPTDDLSHPTLRQSPAALNSFFTKYISEKNLIRVRAHITEGLGTSQRFMRWERQSEKIGRALLQTTGSQWDRSGNAVTVFPLLAAAQKVSQLGVEQPASEPSRSLLKDIDLESTPLANDVSVQELISLGEKVADAERTSVHSTRCVSCHGLDDALTMAREGRPVAQRGISPVRLTLFGVSSDARPVISMRTLRSAEADAIRFEEEGSHVKPSAQHN